MIDLHCHLLPGIDDGAQNISQGLQLARAAVENGITHVIATPHIHFGRYQNSIDSISSACSAFRRVLQEENVPIELGFSAEIRICSELPDLIVRKEIPFLGYWQGSPVVLLELPHSHIPVGVEQLLLWLRRQNVRPMIAHPERNKDILRNFSNIAPLVRNDCLFQVTAGALTGAFGEAALTRSKQLLKWGLVTVLATDAHHVIRRPPILAEGRRAAAVLVGESRSWDLVWNNPAHIAASHFSKESEPERYTV